jgi:hypothetical protein
MIAMMAARTASPMSARLEGEVQLEVALPLVFRVLDQRANILAILAVLVLGSGLVGDRWISHGLFLFAVVAMIGILLFPRRYRFTSGGVSPSRSAFRAWNEFRGWQASGNVIRLEGDGRFGSLKLYVAGKDREGVQKLIVRHLRSRKSLHPKGGTG